MLKIKNFYTLLAIFMVLLVISISVDAAQNVSIKKLSKINKNGYIQGSAEILDYTNSLDHTELVISYSGKRPRTTSLISSSNPNYEVRCLISKDKSYTCILNTQNKVGEDVTNQFKISQGMITITTSNCEDLTADSLKCNQGIDSYNFKFDWETPEDLQLGYYQLSFIATDTNGKSLSDKDKFKIVKRRLILSTHKPTTSNTNNLPQPTNSGIGNDNKNNNGNLPIEPITLQELVQCQKILVEIQKGMQNPSQLPVYTMADLNKDGIVSLGDLVVFQQNFKNPGWCITFFEPTLETSG